MLPLKVDLTHVHLSDEQFYQLCLDNPNLVIERDRKGALIFMSPVGGESGNLNSVLARITCQPYRTKWRSIWLAVCA